MKKIYLRPDASVVYFETDIITSSITEDFEHVNFNDEEGMNII